MIFALIDSAKEAWLRVGPRSTCSGIAKNLIFLKVVKSFATVFWFWFMFWCRKINESDYSSCRSVVSFSPASAESCKLFSAHFGERGRVWEEKSIYQNYTTIFMLFLFPRFFGPSYLVPSMVGTLKLFLSSHIHVKHLWSKFLCSSLFLTFQCFLRTQTRCMTIIKNILSPEIQIKTSPLRLLYLSSFVKVNQRLAIKKDLLTYFTSFVQLFQNSRNGSKP